MKHKAADRGAGICTPDALFDRGAACDAAAEALAVVISTLVEFTPLCVTSEVRSLTTDGRGMFAAQTIRKLEPEALSAAYPMASPLKLLEGWW